MKSIKTYPAIFQSQSNFLNRIQLSPDGGEGGEGIEFTPEQEQVIQQRISAELEKNKPTLQSATKFLQNSGAKVFLGDKEFQETVVNTLSEVTNQHIDNPNDLQKQVLKFKSGLIGEVLSPVDQTIKELTGIEKEENEKTRDYAKRALAAVRKDGAIDEGEYNAIKGKLTTANKQYQELLEKHEGLKTEITQKELKSLITNGLPENLDYDARELQVMMPGIQAQVNQSYEFKKDERGWVAINKETQEPVLDAEGKRVPIDQVVKNYVSSLQGIRFKKEDGGKPGAGLPGDGKSGLKPEQKQEAEKAWKAKLDENNLVGHERQAFVLRKELGLPISAKAAERWPELKD